MIFYLKKRPRRTGLSKLVLLAFILALTMSGIRMGLAVNIVKQAKEASELKGLALGSTTTLRILPLFDAWARANQFQSGHGVSYLIETDEATILMDLGNNQQNTDPAPLLHNIQRLGIDTNLIDAVVISHNHPDHVGGMTWWRKGSFAWESEGSPKVYLPKELTHSSLETTVATEPLIIAPGVATLGRMPFLEPFPFRLWQPLGWEQALLINVEGEGLVVILGCGHPSMERIILEAEAQFNLPVIGIVGGLHYGKANTAKLEPHINFLAERNPELVALSPHDSNGAVLQAFEAAFPQAYRYVTVGWPIEFPQN